ncbi:unnamed protein product [Rangifer tarandus platyrhynchus]|uniref:Uncharacterized protein n=1 Tax=Rangifer tarandus platyrhynchus TaxID=3082113 RepID=A0ABN8ZHS3_RANTA|nr:unnamed protein product [Rangifer tarandus platyrhynchus]
MQEFCPTSATPLHQPLATRASPGDTTHQVHFVLRMPLSSMPVGRSRGRGSAGKGVESHGALAGCRAPAALPGHSHSQGAACSGEGAGQPCPLLQGSFDPRAWREEGLQLQQSPLPSLARAALLRPSVTLVASVSAPERRPLPGLPPVSPPPALS